MILSCVKELIIFCNKPKCDIYLTTNSSYTNLYSYKKTSEHRCSYKKNKEICYCYHFIHRGRNWEKSRGLFQFQVLEAPTLMDLIQKKKKKKQLYCLWLQGFHCCRGSNDIIQAWVVNYSFVLSFSDGFILIGFPFMIQISVKSIASHFQAQQEKLRFFF